MSSRHRTSGGTSPSTATRARAQIGQVPSPAPAWREGTPNCGTLPHRSMKGGTSESPAGALKESDLGGGSGARVRSNEWVMLSVELVRLCSDGKPSVV